MDKTNQKTNETDNVIRKEVISIGKNSSVYFIGQALSRAVGFFMIPLYTHYISPTNYGSMEMIEIIAGAIGMIFAMGVSDAMPRFYYEEKEQADRNRVVSTIILGLGILSIPLVFIFLMLSKYLSVIILDEEFYRYILQISILSIWFSMLCEIGYTYLRMLYMAKTFVILTMIQLFAALSLNIYFIVYLKLDILGIFYSTLITQGFIGLFLAVTILRKIGLKISLSLLKKLVSFGLPVIPSRVTTMLGFVSNRFFLRWMAAPDPAVALAQVGLFSLGHKFGVIINRFVNVPFNSFWGPRRLELVVNGLPQAKETVARVCTYATFLTLYFALMLSAGIENLIKIIADPGYEGAYIVVPFVALSYVALGLETHFSTGILVSRKTKWLTYISLVSISVVLLWNFIFVPRFGLIGAATSNLAGFIFRLGLIYFISQRLHSIPFELKRLFILFLTAVIIFISSQFIEFQSDYLTFLMRSVFVLFYPILLFVFRFFNKGEISFFMEKITDLKKIRNILSPKWNS
jgi:O-antigen/teichoic acid export membrane protein